MPDIFLCETKGADKTKEKSSPNIIILLADDLGWGDLGCYGNPIIKTPHLDRLAKEGMRFDRAFCTNSICTPSRASVLTGKYSHMNSVPTLYETLPDDQDTFPKILKKAGYFTGMIGKWHLHTEPQGFDYWKVMIDQGRYHDPIYCEKGK